MRPGAGGGTWGTAVRDLCAEVSDHDETVERAVAALEAGKLVVIPTDTVYGLACLAESQESALALYRLKGRKSIQPTAIVTGSVEQLLECLPEVGARAVAAVRAVLPGPFTLVLPNPARRFSWLSGSHPDTIGVRVPVLEGPGADVLGSVTAVVATSANLPGGADPHRPDEVPAAIQAGIAVLVDGGELPGTPSTVIDLTGAEPMVLREGAGDVRDAMARIHAATW